MRCIGQHLTPLLLITKGRDQDRSSVLMVLGNRLLLDTFEVADSCVKVLRLRCLLLLSENRLS